MFKHILRQNLVFKTNLLLKKHKLFLRYTFLKTDCDVWFVKKNFPDFRQILSNRLRSSWIPFKKVYSDNQKTQKLKID